MCALLLFFRYQVADIERYKPFVKFFCLKKTFFPLNRFMAK